MSFFFFSFINVFIFFPFIYLIFYYIRSIFFLLPWQLAHTTCLPPWSHFFSLAAVRFCFVLFFLRSPAVSLRSCNVSGPIIRAMFVNCLVRNLRAKIQLGVPTCAYQSACWITMN